MKFLFLDGVKKILGYEDTTFTPSQNIDIIHPTYRQIVIEYTKSACKTLCNANYNALIDKAHFCIQFPALKADTSYTLIEMDISSLVANQEGIPLAYYIRFKTLGSYDNSPVFIKPTIFFKTDDDMSAEAHAAESEILKNTQAFFMMHLGLTKAEQEELQRLNEKIKKVKYTIESEDNTVENGIHSKQILLKAQKQISPAFKDALSVAQYLQKIGII